LPWPIRKAGGLAHLTRENRKRPSITVSTGSLEAPKEVRIPMERFVCPDDPEKVSSTSRPAAMQTKSVISSNPCHAALRNWKSKFPPDRWWTSA
jgi:hypothetical protein